MYAPHTRAGDRLGFGLRTGAGCTHGKVAVCIMEAGGCYAAGDWKIGEWGWGWRVEKEDGIESRLGDGKAEIGCCRERGLAGVCRAGGDA